MSVSNYDQAVEYLLKIPKFTKKNPLEHTKGLLKALGSPQEAYKVIRVAGTNGKGSVCAYISSVLTTAGKKTGLFTSPHLVHIEERFRTDGEVVSEEQFLKAFHTVYEAAHMLMAQGEAHPTFFEYLFCMGAVIFKESNVDYAILETGLGGRLDATNAVEHPVLTVITSIGLDHTELLGNSLEEIAGEKAGIIKPNVPVVYEGSNQKSAAVIEKKAKSAGAKAYPLLSKHYEISKRTDKSIDFLFRNEYDRSIRIKLQGAAAYQVQNAALAILALQVLSRNWQNLTVEEVLCGIEKTCWDGRMEEVLPGVWIDGAHNENAIRAFLQSAAHINGKQKKLLFTAVKEKNVEQMVELIAKSKLFQEVIVTEIYGERAVSAARLMELFGKYKNLCVKAEPDNEKAFKALCAYRQKGDVVFAAGSLYLVGRIKEIIEEAQHD